MRNRDSVICGALMLGLLSPFVGVLRAASPCEAELEVPKYSVLWEISSETPVSPPTMVTLRVSVEEWLGLEDLKSVVCAILSDPDLRAYGMIWISFYYQLDDYISKSVDQDSDLAKRSIGSYAWTRSLSDSNHNMALYKDQRGKAVRGRDKFHKFDHNRDCPRRVPKPN